MPVEKLPFEEFKFIYGKVPRLCVDLVISAGKEIILILRDINPGKGLWHLPGGTVLKGESLSEAINRIAGEETGLNVSAPEFKGIIEFSDHQNPFFHTVSLVFRVEISGGELKTDKNGKAIQTFDTLPDPMISEQRTFLLNHFYWLNGRDQ